MLWVINKRCGSTLVFFIFTNIAVAAYYCYLESWTLSWAYHSILGDFNGMDQPGVQAFLTTILVWVCRTDHILIFCLLLNTYILSRGLSGGVEIAAKVGMPLLILFGVFLAYKGYTTTAGVAGAINDGTVGLNFCGHQISILFGVPKYGWLQPGQIFFTYLWAWVPFIVMLPT